MRSLRHDHPILRRLISRGPEFAAGALGVFWFLVLGGGRTLRVTDLDWLAGDQRQHVLGWLFFRQSSWALPLGRVTGFAAPLGTTVAFTDSNPLLALPLRLVSGVLPGDFQYIGPWLLVCFALQGWAGARLASIGSERPAYRLAGGAFLALAPVLAARHGHDTLCAHFLILTALAVALGAAIERRSALRRMRVVIALASLVHPYLAVMTLATGMAVVARLHREGALTRREAWRSAGGLVLVMALVMLPLGYFTSAPSHSWGFGLFSLDPTAFWNPMGWSRILPTRPAAFGQAEGFAYLGVGGIALLAVVAGSSAAAWRRGARPPARLLPLAVVAGLLFVLALSSVIRVSGRTWLDLRWLYAPVYPLMGPFRSSGRFVWVLYYGLLGGALAWLPGLLGGRVRVAALVVVIAAALQAADLSGMAGRVFVPEAWRPDLARWSLAAGRYRQIQLIPPLVVGAGGACLPEDVYRDLDAYAPFAYVAYSLRASINSGYLARASARRFEPVCLEQIRLARAGLLDPAVIYVVQPREAAAFLATGAATCGRLEGSLVCVSARNADPFRDALERTAAADSSIAPARSR